MGAAKPSGAPTEHPLGHWATGGTRLTRWRHLLALLGRGPPLQPAPHVEREANHAAAANTTGCYPHCEITV